MAEGARQMEITLAPHVTRLLEEEAEALDSTPADVVEDMVRHWAHHQRVRKARIIQVEGQRKQRADDIAADVEVTEALGGC